MRGLTTWFRLGSITLEGAPCRDRSEAVRSLARERDETVVAAGVALDAQEAVRDEHTTQEIGADLARGEASDGSIRGTSPLEGPPIDT